MDRRGTIPNRARISNKLTMAKLYHNSKNIEDVRALRETNKLDIETLVHLTGYKEWIYTKDMAEALVSEEEGHDDWCKETIIFAFDYATTTWDFDREACDILVNAWLKEDS